MDALSIFALLVLCVLVATALYIVIFLAKLPGRIAASRSNPQAEAIKMCGWMGIITLILWPIALVCAYMKPLQGASDNAADLPEHIRKLADRVAVLEQSTERASKAEGGSPS